MANKNKQNNNSKINGVRVYKRFNGVDREYFPQIKVTSSTYGYIHTNSVVVGDNMTHAYKITRDIEAKSFGVMTDRFYAGLLSVYAEIFDEMENKAYDEEKFTKLYVFCHETDNDLVSKTISFDINFIPSKEDGNVDGDKVLQYMDKDNTKFTAIFNYGMIYTEAVNKLKLFDRVYHVKAFKVQEEGMHRVNLPSDAYYNNDTKSAVEFISNLLNDDSEILKYVIGITKEEITK